ncbi:hypothetical protein [Azoarcus olearius]|uniref:hypothetical protein n=1 Tax=Azoarcus sp. (strain BH72) TaxID=418699 RepID=UPI0011D19E4E|nr:hypothetical protein [Azoarcus olearius]
MKNQLISIANSAKQSVSTAGSSISSVLETAKDCAVTVATTILDQDGDGKLDQEDLKQITQKGLNLAKDAATEVGRLASEAAKTDLAKDSAAAAVVGAAIAVPVPIIGPMAGAAIGAAFGAYKNLTKK